MAVLAFFPTPLSSRYRAVEGVDISLLEELAADGFAGAAFEEDVVREDHGGVAVLLEYGEDVLEEPKSPGSMLRLVPVAKGDKILIRGHHPQSGLTNGDFKKVAFVEPETRRIVFTDGRELPIDFAAWTYGHALTSYRSQGTTSEESLLVLGEVATRALARRQFYVGNTRFRGAHAIYLSQKEEIFRRLAQPDRGRELATEFAERRSISEREQMISRPQQNLSTHVRRARLSEALRQEQSNGQRYSL